MMRARMLLAACALGLAGTLQAQEQVIFAAMQDELQRSMKELRIAGQPAPYYIAYQVDELSARRVTARLGEVTEDGSARNRTLRVEVRVGDYAFDSSRFVSLDRNAGLLASETLSAPLDDDYDVMRRQIWLLTDGAYKRAVKIFAAKKAAYQNRSPGELIADFSKSAPVERLLAPVLPATAWTDWTERLRQVSGAFLSTPDIMSSEVNLIEERGRRYYLNSEGFRIMMPLGMAGLRVVADTQAEDGGSVRDYFEIFERTVADMPSAQDLVARTRALATRMDALRTKKVGEEYTGPVLIEGRAGAELVALALVPALLANRAPDTDTPALERVLQGAQSPFLSRIGSKVMSEDLSVSDTPSLTQSGARPVAGAYELDDEGVPAQDVTLVEGGKLLTLLTSRVPQRNLPQSNGHGRGGAVQAGVVQVKSASAVPSAQLKASYLAMLKTQGRPFGYIVRSLAAPGSLIGSADPGDIQILIGGQGGQGGPAGPLLPQLVKVTADGSEEVVRGMRFGNLSPNLFRNVLGASQERELLTYRGNQTVSPFASSFGGRQVPVSVIAPAFIIDDLEIQRLVEVPQKLPVVPSPLKR